MWSVSRFPLRETAPGLTLLSLARLVRQTAVSCSSSETVHSPRVITGIQPAGSSTSQCCRQVVMRDRRSASEREVIKLITDSPPLLCGIPDSNRSSAAPENASSFVSRKSRDFPSTGAEMVLVISRMNKPPWKLFQQAKIWYYRNRVIVDIF